MAQWGVTLESILQASDQLKEVGKEELRPGDWVLAKTRNSTYRIRALGDGFYEVSGGWFDRHRMSSSKMRIHGCTWGSRTIKTEIVAACGMSIEFSNRITTSSIRAVAVIPGCRMN